MKVLVIVDNLDYGGVAKVARNLSESCAKEADVVFDYVCYLLPKQETINELKDSGSSYYVIPRVTEVGFIKYINNIRDVLRNSIYDAVHIHTSYFIWLAAYAAKKENIQIRIGHAHGSIGPYSNLIKKQKLFKVIQSRVIEILGRSMNRKFCTHMLACAHESGEYTFGTGFEFIPNIVKHNNIKIINATKKNLYFEEFGIPKDSIILGYLGVVGLLKNTKFFLPLMKRISQEEPKYVLIIAGDGPDFQFIKEMIEDENLSDKIIMAGYREDNHELLQFFDILLMPSFTEGMSLSILESQICGTPVIASKGVPNSNDVGLKLFHKVKSYQTKEWAELIYSIPTNLKKNVENNRKYIESSEFAEKNVVKMLINIYFRDDSVVGKGVRL